MSSNYSTSQKSSKRKVCHKCKITTTPTWRSGAKGVTLCNACGISWKRSLTNNKSSKPKTVSSKRSKSTTTSTKKQKASKEAKETTIPQHAGAFMVKPTETSKATTQERTLQATTENTLQHKEQESCIQSNGAESTRTEAPPITIENGDTEASKRARLNGAGASASTKAKVAPKPKPSATKRSKPPTGAKRTRDDDDLDYEEVHSDDFDCEETQSDQVIRNRSTRTRRAPKRYSNADHEPEERPIAAHPAKRSRVDTEKPLTKKQLDRMRAVFPSSFVSNVLDDFLNSAPSKSKKRKASQEYEYAEYSSDSNIEGIGDSSEEPLHKKPHLGDDESSIPHETEIDDQDDLAASILIYMSYSVTVSKA